MERPIFVHSIIVVISGDRREIRTFWSIDGKKPWWNASYDFLIYLSNCPANFATEGEGKKKWKSQNWFFVTFCWWYEQLSNGDSFFLKAITYQLLQHHQSLSPTVWVTHAGLLLQNNEFIFRRLKNKKNLRNSIGAKLWRPRSNRQQHNPPKNESRPHPSSSFCHFQLCLTIIRKTSSACSTECITQLCQTFVEFSESLHWLYMAGRRIKYKFFFFLKSFLVN